MKTTYTVKRMKTLSWHRDNPKYKVWKYHNTPALENMVRLYFEQLNG